MGILANIYRNHHGDCSNGGISAEFDTVCIVNADGPFEPSADHPAVKLVVGPSGRGGNQTYNIIARPYMKKGVPMFGGSFIYSSDSRFSELVERLSGSPRTGAIPFHDRYE